MIRTAGFAASRFSRVGLSPGAMAEGDDDDATPPLPPPSSVSDEEYDEEVAAAAANEMEDCDDDAYDSDEVDSGMGSDELDVADIGEAATEVCQVGDTSLAVPLDLYDLPGLGSVLSLDAWNQSLSDEDRIALTAFFPDMDRETFARTLVELLGGDNFHFGSPLSTLFDQLKGGLCDPRIVQYRHGLRFFEQRKHYHFLRQYHNSMVSDLVSIRNAWKNCRAYSIHEKLQVLSTLKSRKRSLCQDNNAGPESDSADDHFFHKGFKSAASTGFVGNKLEKKSKGRLPSSGHISQNTGGHGPAPLRAKKYQSSKSQIFFPSDSRNHPERVAIHEPMTQRNSLLNHSIGLPGIGHHDDFVGPSFQACENGNTDQAVTSYETQCVGASKKARYSDAGKGSRSIRRNRRGQPSGSSPVINAGQHGRIVKEGTFFDRPDKLAEKWVAPVEYVTGNYPVYEAKVVTSRGIKEHTEGLNIGSNLTGGRSKTKSVKYKKLDEYSSGGGSFSGSEETESDDSERAEESEGFNSIAGQTDYPQHGVLRPIFSPNKPGKYTSKHTSVDELPSNAASFKRYSTKATGKGKVLEPGYLYEVPLENHTGEELLQMSTKSFHVDRKRKAGNLDMHDNNFMSNDSKDVLHEGLKLEEIERPAVRMTHGTQVASGEFEAVGATLHRCSSSAKKQKRQAEKPNLNRHDAAFAADLKLQPDGTCSSKKGKRKGDVGLDPAMLVSPEFGSSTPTLAYLEPEKPQKKPYTPITPSTLTGFSFSIIHLFSAVRNAMLSPAEQTSEVGNGLDQNNETFPSQVGLQQFQPNSNTDAIISGQNLLGLHTSQGNSYCFPLQEIVNRVRSNPGDPCVLETEEPLQDLVRGVLKILGSRTTPLTAKNWKPLVSYEKSLKCWSWIGPVGTEGVGIEDTSPEAWGMSHYNLGKLVDAFAIWLRSTQETLKLIGSLPAPPAAMLSAYSDKERFKDLRAQKSLITISPSSAEIKSYFQREEFLRYSIPDRSFCYTAADGKKSIVAPLRRGGGKPTSKARDHFMLKPDRPPHVTILCLVRDAAARLPGNIGTRADVCTLLRDSQYIVEDVPDAQVNQIVSGALDRLHYERDPCVQFDAERKLWVYLHKDRVEEDFEDDGTSSTKKWKKSRKEVDPSDDGAWNGVEPLTEDPAACSTSDNHDNLFASKGDENPELIYVTPGIHDIDAYINMG